ncbi:hypothetical protein CWB96_21780 [Pseudoalteromonas citrea]|uniref:Uncharacterized protein n=1 Tax=Pseudoalteromonas citrea TaxID=43655 RepID=A0A5S3XHB1_9GAMM|nr:hypothetical protein [Pseudoalteromonas citrea]TMP37853.1 hypothetical protein CWB97_22425 [Pseudoalteromonas citrea]TMP52386.1 hypothetical protein CWB96_21780 [Pseudoalteromonas citrea]
MKSMFYVALAACGFCAQATQTIYDQDTKANRVSDYQYGPVAQIMVPNTSSISYIESIVTLSSVEAQCNEAALYNDTTNSKIADLTVSFPAVYGNIPTGFAQAEKSIRLSCTQGNDSFIVHHKVPAAPTITWSSDVVASGWADNSCVGRDCPTYPGYFSDVQYSAQILVNNNADDGTCSTINHVGQAPDLLPGYQHSTPINSNHFAPSGKAIYDANGGYLVTRIICQNAGGTTVGVEVWDINQRNTQREVHFHTI